MRKRVLLMLLPVAAAIGLAQLGKLDGFIEARRRNHRRLYEHLQRYQDQLILPEATSGSDPSWFGFMVVIRENAGLKRRDLVAYLEKYQIQTRMLFAGNLLRQGHVATVPGEGFGTREHIRVSYATSIAELDRGLERMRSFLTAL